MLTYEELVFELNSRCDYLSQNAYWMSPEEMQVIRKEIEELSLRIRYGQYI